MQNPKKYTIKNKNIAVIAKKLRVPQEELILYHNSHAPIADLISNGIPDHLEYVYGPPLGYGLKNGMLYRDPTWKASNWINQYQCLENIGSAQLGYSFQLGFVHSKHNQTEDLENHTDLETTNPLFEDSHTVEDITKTNKTDSDSVCSETSSPNLQKQELQLHYRWEGKGINAQNNPAAVLHAGAVFLEQKEPSGAIEKIAAAIGKASYPAQLQFNYANISHLVNHSSLVAQWEITKERLLIENSGDYAKNIVEKANRYIQNKHVLLEKLKQSWFLVCYQLLLRIQFAGRDYFETTMGFPIATGCSPIAYRVQAEKHPFCNSNGKLVVYLQGSPCDSRSLAAIEAGKKFDQQNAGKAITGSLAATAIFDASHQYIEQLFGHIRIHLQNSCKTVEIGLYKKDSL